MYMFMYMYLCVFIGEGRAARRCLESGYENEGRSQVIRIAVTSSVLAAGVVRQDVNRSV